MIIKTMIPLSRQSACASTAEEKAKNAKLKPKRRKIKTEPKQLHEDFCFQCGDGGELVMCDRKDCPKAYHLLCLNLPQPPYGERPRGPCSGQQRGQVAGASSSRCAGGRPWAAGLGSYVPRGGQLAPVVWSWGQSSQPRCQDHADLSWAEAWSCGQPDAASSWRGRWEAGCLVGSGPGHSLGSVLLPASPGKWECPWHQCDECSAAAIAFCEFCPRSFCKEHEKGALVPSTLESRLCCSEHDPASPVSPEYWSKIKCKLESQDHGEEVRE